MAENLNDFLLQIAQQYGYLGVFTVSLLGSLIPFLPVPYLFVVVLLSDSLDPFLLGLVSGLGGSLGKVTSYALGRGGYRFFSQETKQRMDTLRTLIGKYGDLGVFIFALTPLPDDVYLIPIGMMRFSFWRFLLANTLGKIILSIFVAYAGRTYFDVAIMLFGREAQLPAIIGAVVVMVIITIVLLRVDWETLAKILKEQGIPGVIRNIGLILNLGKKNK